VFYVYSSFWTFLMQRTLAICKGLNQIVKNYNTKFIKCKNIKISSSFDFFNIFDILNIDLDCNYSGVSAIT